MAAKDSGKVNIHGREYETVASRVQRFRAEHGTKYTIRTQIVSESAERVIMQATIYEYIDGSNWRDIASGYAEESRSSSAINKTSALEVAETSAIGRALANFGMAGTEYASADEVANAINQQSAPRGSTAPQKAAPASEGPKLATKLQKQRITAYLRSQGVPDEDMSSTLTNDFGVDDPKNMTEAEAFQILEAAV